MHPFKLKAGSPMLFLIVVISGCNDSPTLMRLECAGESMNRGPVFDRQTGQLYHHIQPDGFYTPQPIDRFSVKTKGRITGDSLVIETRVGRWSESDAGRVLTALNPPVGSDFIVDLTTLKTTTTSLLMKNGRPVFDPKFGQCKTVPLATRSVKRK